MELIIGQKAPEFSLLDQYGKNHSLHDYSGKWLVLYFYPKDDTPGCTAEACSFRDNTKAYSDKNISVLGVSKDSVASHVNFASKYKLDFPLLSDESKTTINAYGAWGKKKFMGREFEGVNRITYLINPQGNIHKIFLKVNPLSHAQNILKEI